MAAPGPEADYRDAQELVDRQVRIATGVNALYDYAGPFADLAAGSAGFSSESTSHIRRNFISITDSLGALIDSDDVFSSSLGVPRSAMTARQRHLAAVVAARTLISESERTLFLPQRVDTDSGHVAIIDFLSRAGERMTREGTDWRWVANASDTLDFGATE